MPSFQDSAVIFLLALHPFIPLTILPHTRTPHQTVRTLRFEYKTLESKQDQLSILVADYKEQLVYKDKVAHTTALTSAMILG